MNAIEIHDLSKCYRIFHKGSKSDTLRGALTAYGKKLCQSLMHRTASTSSAYETFWALQGVDLTIAEGDRVGIIGRNGAGKSTLLKVLSQIVEPSSGTVKIRGRVASLLEVGTGFHPELTGRENIYLNGAILGMTHQEIKKKFDEIVDFAEVEKFLDTPVKRYSSGMYMRLGFAIAASLEPDILIVDEILAVGDAAFQEKCFKRMNGLGQSGRTILFVSHNVNSLMALCDKGVYLQKGRVVQSGAIGRCVQEYMRNGQQASTVWRGQEGDESIQLLGLSVHSQGEAKDYFNPSQEAYLRLEYEVLQPHPHLDIGFYVSNARGQKVASAHISNDERLFAKHQSAGHHVLEFPLPMHLFHEGDYFIYIDAYIYNIKLISHDEVGIKMTVLNPNKEFHFTHTLEREGLLLGKNWKMASDIV